MWRRVGKALGAFLATVVAYQVYALVAVPWIEPPAPERAGEAATDEQWRAGAHAVGRYQQLLASYFPPGHWCLTGAPKVVESGQLMLVLEDYQRSDDGRVSLSKCAVVTFPTPRRPGAPPPRDAVIIEAPGGGTLQFDDAFNPTRGKVGRPVRGVFPGELVVRSDMEQPGDEDDLRVVTRDLRLEQTMLLTDAPATFRLGPHTGRGRKLEIRLVRESDAAPSGGGMGIAGVSSLELREDVEATLRLPQRGGDNGSLVGGDELLLTSAGPFRFDFTRFVASLQREVRATLRRAEGPSDQLFCTELRLHLSDDPSAPTTLSPADEPEFARTQSAVLGDLQPYLIEALGDPVRVDSPGRQATARGRRLRLWIADRRLRIDGAPRTPATLAHGLHEAHAAWIDYRAPAADSQDAIGALSMAGPGWLRVATRKGDPSRLLEARWRAVDDQGSEAVRLARDRRGRPLLLIAGGPEVAATGLGRLRSDQLSVRLRETPPDGRDGPAIEIRSPSGGNPGGGAERAVVVERIDARGDVRFRGRELEGAADNLIAWFREMPEEDRGSAPASRRAGAGGDAAASKATKRLYKLTAGEVQLDVGLFGRRAEPTGLLCSGGVEFRQAPGAEAEQPLVVTGAELRVEGLHREHVRLTIAGKASDGRADAAPRDAGDNARRGHAEILAGSVRMWARDLSLDQEAGRVWTRGPIDVRMRLDEKLGRALGAEAGEATLRARGGLDFDGKAITLRDDVLAEATNGWVHATELTAWLAEPIDLRSGDAPDAAIAIAEVACRGGVSIDQRAIEAGGQTSHQRARLSTLRYNRLTGDLSGDGPGWVRSVHLSDGDDELGALGGGAAPAKLRFLRVNFRQGVSGNAERRALRFHERVRAVYGPVLTWDQELPVESPTGAPPDAVTLACEELRVHEDPASRGARPTAGATSVGPLELQAIRAVRIEGESSQRGGSFVAEAAAASYTQLKEVFVLEGGASRDATLWLRQRPDQPPAQSVARKITYHRVSGRVKVEDIRGFNYQAGSGAGFAAPRR